jgi:outer membrane protein OmpA-like peptidoglycan-associated protein
MLPGINNKEFIMRKYYTLPIIILTGAALAACSTQPEKNSALEDARAGYRAAQTDAEVTNLAAVELQQAGKALDKANEAQKEGEDRKEIDHLAYLANQRIAIAQNTAKLKSAELAVANAGTERDKVRLEMRTAEADATKRQMAESDAAAKQRAVASGIAADEAAAALALANADTEQSRALLEAQAAEIDAANQQAMIAKQREDQKMAELNAANTRVSQMEAELKRLNAKETERGLVITLGDVLFDTNKADLRPEVRSSLQKLAEFFKEYPERKAIIEGYTDSTGESDYNQNLSDRRANSVRNTLMDMGVSGDRISTRGYGETNPIASNATAAGRQLNRRVEIVFPEDDSSISSR